MRMNRFAVYTAVVISLTAGCQTPPVKYPVAESDRLEREAEMRRLHSDFVSFERSLNRIRILSEFLIPPAIGGTVYGAISTYNDKHANGPPILVLSASVLLLASWVRFSEMKLLGVKLTDRNVEFSAQGGTFVEPGVSTPAEDVKNSDK